MYLRYQHFVRPKQKMFKSEKPTGFNRNNNGKNNQLPRIHNVRLHSIFSILQVLLLLKHIR